NLSASVLLQAFLRPRRSLIGCGARTVGERERQIAVLLEVRNELLRRELAAPPHAIERMVAWIPAGLRVRYEGRDAQRDARAKPGGQLRLSQSIGATRRAD